MNEVDKLIMKLIEEKGGSREDYLNLLNSIAYHESAHTMDPSIKQKGGGPGRGLYQFEEGENAGAITAARRTKKYLEEAGLKVPKWLNNIKDNSLDASKLNKSQQDMLFLGNMRMHPKADFKKVWDGEESVEDFWANYHWAGKAVDRPKRLKSFKDSLANYNPDKIKNINTPPSVTATESIINTVVKPEESDFQADYMPDIIKFSKGGLLPSNNINKTLNSFNVGGLHETNPYGGIPQGTGANGKINTVEQGETSFNMKDGKYIFSNRIIIS